MYMVVSRWEPLPGKEAEFEVLGRKMRNYMRTVPGIVLVEGFESEDGSRTAVLGYESREAYERIVKDPNGPFEKASRENRLEDCARWISSDRGESIVDRDMAGSAG